LLNNRELVITEVEDEEADLAGAPVAAGTGLQVFAVQNVHASEAVDKQPLRPALGEDDSEGRAIMSCPDGKGVQKF
jgi:hypothetical protein